MLLIREEDFGGFVFNTRNGSRVSLDDEGFKAFETLVSDRKKLRDEEVAFLEGICGRLELAKKEHFSLINVPKKTTKAYPFEVYRSPVLLDLQITTRCNLFCPHCYVNSSASGQDASLEDITKVFDQAQEAGVFEIALGGGEPTLHPHFETILKECDRRHIVPNLATNGCDLSNAHIKAMKRYCGAVALSLEHLGVKFEKRRGYAFSQFLDSVQRLKRENIQVVFQVTVSQSNLSELADIAKFLVTFEPYGIVFLTFKPVGRAICYDTPLSKVDIHEIVPVIKACFFFLEGKTKVGYDCCLANALIGTGVSNDCEIQGCSALRTSIAVNWNLDIVPCSFSAQVVGNLNQTKLIDVWNGDQAALFRERFQSKVESQDRCKSCTFKWTCLGGCPEFNLVSCTKS